MTSSHVNQLSRRSKSGSKGKFGVKEYLDDYRYHIEYGGYLSNHAKHAVIALEGLGVSEERIGNYFDFYRKKHGLEPAIESKNAIDKTNWKKYIGEKKYFMDYVEFFDKEEKRLGMEGLINTYMPQLIDGCVSALHHCTIHLGWALHAKNRLMIIEGLAYFAFAHVPTHLPSSKEFKARQDSSVLDTLKAIAAAAESSQLSKWTDKVFADPKYSAERFHPELKDTGLQWRIAMLLAEGHPLIHSRCAWMDSLKIEEIFKQLYYAAAILYISQPGDFVLLHVITGLWGMEAIVEALESEKDKRNAIFHYWSAIVATAAARKGNVYKAGLPGSKDVEELYAKYSEMTDDKKGADDKTRSSASKPSQLDDWPTLYKRGEASREEHNPKLVYVCRQLWERYDNLSVFHVAANSFTTSPLEDSYEKVEKL